MSVLIHDCPSPNCEERRKGAIPIYLILHYTGCPADEAAACYRGEKTLTGGGRVSPHYMVDEDGTITRFVPENKRAWHAGASFWRGETDLNSLSIGIEVVNPGHDGGYPPFSDIQTSALTALCRSILSRHPRITPTNVLGHSDIAPGRKLDPGPAFPWTTLAAAGVGVMPAHPIPAEPDPENLEIWLTRIGYNPQISLIERARAALCHYAPALWTADLTLEKLTPLQAGIIRIVADFASRP